MAATTWQRTFVTGTGLTSLLTVTHLFNDAFANILPALLPIIQERFTLSETLLAVFVATISLSANVLQPLFGALSDRMGRRLVAALGIVACSALLSLIGVAPNPWVLFALLLIGGFGSAAFHPAAGSLVRAAGQGRQGLGMSLFMAGGPVGSALGPVAVLFVIAQFGVGYTPWLMIPGVLLGVAVYLFIAPQERVTGESRPKLFDAQLFLGPVGLLCLVGILRSIAYVTFVNAMPLWLVQAQNVARDSVLIGLTLATYSASAAVGGIIATILADRFGRLPIIASSMLLAIPVLHLVFLYPAGSLPYFAAVGFSGLLTNAAIPLLIVTAQDHAPHAVATASGMLMGFTWGTAGVLYIAIGRMQETLGLMQAMSLSYFVLIPAVLLSAYVFTRQDKEPLTPGARPADRPQGGDPHEETL